MTIDRLSPDALRGSFPRCRSGDRGDLAERALLGGFSERSSAADDEVLKMQLREELLRQARRRLPITYAALANRIACSARRSAGMIRNALERLMEDDADEGRPLLAAIAVRTLEPGLPAPWFFRKAECIGLFAGDAANVEAYAFHAREFHRAVRFHAGPAQHRRGAGKESRPALAAADK